MNFHPAGRFIHLFQLLITNYSHCEFERSENSLERVRRIELLATAWKAVVLPLYDARQGIPLLRGYAMV